MKIVYSPKTLEYQSRGHPESPRRVELIYKELTKDKRFKFIKPREAEEKDLLLVHSWNLINSVKKNTFSDPNTPNNESIFGSALLAVGSAITASKVALEKSCAFSLSRPPGHHATKTSVGGFCYFNNIAVAVAKLLEQEERAAIVDLDAHHGNGTQEIFLDKDNIILCSLHQIPLYPGTGGESESNCYNFPLSPGSSFVEYKEKLETAIFKIKEFNPSILAVSLGFDTYRGDSLANINLDLKDYNKMGKIISELSLPTFFVLEGGYSEDIGKCAKEFFDGFIE